MKIDFYTLSESIKYFRLGNMISPHLLMRKYKVSYDMGKYICDTIERRFPNLWRHGKEKLEFRWKLK
jgi:hypothetical protein